MPSGDKLSWNGRVAAGETPALRSGVPFDVSFDGKRLLINRAEEEIQAPLQVITNWPAGLHN
jgi:hypothetical protein